MKWIPERTAPYSIKAHWFEIGLYGSAILILSYCLLSFEIGQGKTYRQAHPFAVLALIVGLGLYLWKFWGLIFRRAIFSENGVNYYFFPFHRQYNYHDLQGIRPASNLSRKMLFTFKNGGSFKVPLAYFDADYLVEFLSPRTSIDLGELTKFRDTFTPLNRRVSR